MLKITTTVIATAVTAAVGFLTTATAAADQGASTTSHALGSQATLTDGDVVQGWTVHDLKPSTDTIAYQPHGTLWEATTTDQAIHGSVVPIVANLNARTASGQNYPSLFGVATAQGVNPSTLSEGQKTSGKVYFDVTGDNPNGVVYTASGQDLASWTQASSSRSGGARSGSPTAKPAGTPGSQATPAPAGWDLTTGVGATATMLAAQRALAASGPNPLIDDPFAAPLVRAVGIDAYTRLVDGDIPIDKSDLDWMAQGIAARTRFYDQHFLDAAKSGVRQAVILAAGLDARAYRLAWPAGTVVYEVDMPQVIEFKTTTLADLGAEPTAQRRTVGVDLRGDWPAALAAAGFDPAAPTVWSAEGLLNYLPAAAQDTLFDGITSLSAPASRLAFEFIQDTTIFGSQAWRTHNDQMRQLGFDTDIGQLVYPSGRSHVVDYLTQRGWQVSSRTFKQLYAVNDYAYPDDELAQGFGDITYLSAMLAG
jgi:methyltransferase (TIGR00027 family)